MKSIESLLCIADIHAKRLRFAKERLHSKIPLTVSDIQNLSDEDLPIFELYTSRFSKLQDFMGATLFTAVLETKGEQTEQMTFIDKLNKLEKLNLITSAKDWMTMRQIRNSLSHEYPEHPELTVKFLNEAFSYTTPLLDTLENIKQFTKKSI